MMVKERENGQKLREWMLEKGIEQKRRRRVEGKNERKKENSLKLENQKQKRR